MGCPSVSLRRRKRCPATRRKGNNRWTPRQTYQAAWRFDQFTLDLARGALLGPDGAEVSLRPKSFALLRLLVDSAGRLVDRDAIMAAVWPTWWSPTNRAGPLEKAAQIRTLNAMRGAHTAAMSEINSRWLHAPATNLPNGLTRHITVAPPAAQVADG